MKFLAFLQSSWRTEQTVDQPANSADAFGNLKSFCRMCLLMSLMDFVRHVTC